MERGYVLPSAVSRGDRIRSADFYYRGCEYCCDALPDPKQAAQMAREDAAANRDVVWVTPFVKQRHLKRVVELLGLVGEQPCVKEIVVNDFGVLAWARARWPSKRFTIGRLLSPFFVNLPSAQMQASGVNRIEVDGLDTLAGAEPSVPVSFHVPYRHMTISDRCPLYDNERGKCRKECMHFPLSVEDAADQGNLLMVGRTLLEMAPVPSVDWRKYNVDRIVWHPTCLS